MSIKLLKGTGVFGGVTLISRITGLMRDITLTFVLGDREAADVFFIAFRIPNFFRRVFGEGAFSAAFIPVYTDLREHHIADVDIFLKLLFGRFSIILMFFSLFGVVFAPEILYLFAAGYTEKPELFSLAVTATRITFPYLFFISLVAFSGAILNTHGRFAVSAGTPMLLNISLIFSALWFPQYVDHPTIALAWGVILAGFTQLLFQIPFLKLENIALTPKLFSEKSDKKSNQATHRVFFLTLPTIFGSSITQINTMVNMSLASFLATGSVTWLYAADRLMTLPVGVFGVAISITVMTQLSRAYSQKNKLFFMKNMDTALRLALLICIPSALGLYLLSYPLVATIFYHGQFSLQGVQNTADCLKMYALGMVFIVFAKIFASGYYSSQDMKTPMKLGIVTVVVNILFSVSLFSYLQHIGLAIATSASALVHAGLLFWFFRLKKGLFFMPGWFLFSIRVVLASTLMGLLLFLWQWEYSYWTNESVMMRVFMLLTLVIGGGLSYFVLLFALGVRKKHLWQDS